MMNTIFLLALAFSERLSEMYKFSNIMNHYRTSPQSTFPLARNFCGKGPAVKPASHNSPNAILTYLQHNKMTPFFDKSKSWISLYLKRMRRAHPSTSELTWEWVSPQSLGTPYTSASMKITSWGYLQVPKKALAQLQNKAHMGPSNLHLRGQANYGSGNHIRGENMEVPIPFYFTS